MEKNMIRVSSGKVRGVLTITECARYIVDKQIQIGEFLHKDDWILYDMRPVNLKDSQSIVNALVKEKKKEIRRHTIIKDIPDDFVDDIPFTDGFFGSREYDDGSSFHYHVNMRSSSLLISNFDKIDGIKDFATLKTFVMMLISVFEPGHIDISEYAFYRELMDMKGGEPRPGPMIYFSKSINLPKLPDFVQVEELPNGGKLLVLTDKLESVSDNKEYLDKLKSLAVLFRKFRLEI